MSIVLAMAWHFNEQDIERFIHLYPMIEALYSGVSIAAPSGSDANLIDRLKALPHIKLFIGQGPNENRRYQTIQQALAFENATMIHYCDGDHVLSRMEQFLPDWKQALSAMRKTDCLIVGRCEAVFESYPPALKETERIINQVGSHLLGQTADFGSGARGFSRRAVEFLVRYASPETHGVATDLEWPMLLSRSGFHIATYVSDGAIYEITNDDQRQRLESVEQWSKRINVARLILQAGIDVANRSDLPER